MEAWFAGRGVEEAIFGATSVADEADFALTAVLGEFFFFVESELALFG